MMHEVEAGLDKYVGGQCHQTYSSNPETDMFRLMAPVMVHLVRHSPHQGGTGHHLYQRVEAKSSERQAVGLHCGDESDRCFEDSPDDGEEFEVTSAPGNGGSIHSRDNSGCHGTSS
jgi:hypothetical protein